MTDSDGYGRYSASGPSDPYAGTYGGAGGYGSPGTDPYGVPADELGSAGSSASAAAAPDPYASSAATAAPGYTGPEFGSGALPYGGPAQPQYYVAPPSSGSATAAMILGILSLTCLPLAGPVAVVLAVMGMKATADGTQGGRGLAIAGLVTGILGTLYLIFVVLWILLYVVVGVWAVGTS
ncbi:membrane protein [Brachybacterium phenoliresistens]|uniref:Membrane protein n=1 Tax=Brachybacterium phenoliresistens TaxID=396014 RepID=Z9JPZ6_9MICO|nr:DUF4190 domain-containing protein [Brachybacterium phenoliresistens]EWS80269.1 membrane protein [Brachybacterium phenoliresistens]